MTTFSKEKIAVLKKVIELFDAKHSKRVEYIIYAWTWRDKLGRDTFETIFDKVELVKSYGFEVTPLYIRKEN